MRDIFSMIAVLGARQAPEAPRAPFVPKQHAAPDMIGLTGEMITGLDLMKMVR